MLERTEASPLAAIESVRIYEPAILFRIYRSYYAGTDLYEATRGTWKIGERRYGARYAFAVTDGIVREVYKIKKWNPAGTTPYPTRDDVILNGRWELVGEEVEQALRAKYIGKSVESYFTPGSRSPFIYVNC